ncbi:MAG: polyprenyl synthetase family protein [Egibacteraceae bacterium]
MTLTLPSVLSRARAVVDPALRDAVGRLQPCTARIVGYHLGWLDADGRPAVADGGKAFRAALALAGARTGGSAAVDAVPGAVAVELVHNFSLIHDDVMDADLQRRHRPTVWAVFGVGPAVLAGDALLALAQQVLVESGSPDRGRALGLLAEATGSLIAGQGQDLAFERRGDVEVAECVAMCAAKTGALLGASAAVGAALCGASEPVVGRLVAFGRHLGVAFQAVDDLLGIWGRPEVTGKPCFNDLRRHKSSLPVVAALCSGGAAAARLGALIRRPEVLGEDELILAAGLVEDAGGRVWARAEAVRRLGLALGQLDGPELDPVARGELADLARFVTDREL